MNYTLSENTLLHLSEFIAANLGLNFPKERWNDLERNIIYASKEFGYKEAENFVQRILTSPLTHEHIEILTAHLTINETYFWREPKTFEALEQIILPDLISRRLNGNRRLRIWSAGCATGEEPYSIAIALNRIIPNINDWNISILATDISPRILRKATTGEYGQWSFRNTPNWLKENYFIKKPNNKYEIIPQIKNMVKFKYLNLAEDVYPSSVNDTNAMDIIYCRNVLMYFTQERFREVARSLFNSLVLGGYFVVSASELSMLNFPDFLPVNVPGMVLYQKTSKKVKDRFNFTLEETPPAPVVFQITPKFEQPVEFIKPQLHQTGKENIEIEEVSKQIDPVNEEALDSYSQGNYGDVIDKLQKDDQTSEEQILLIRAFANQGKLTEAIESCKIAITANKIDPRLHYLYATILQENNQMDEAVASLKHAIYLDSNFVLAYYSLGNIYMHLGNVHKTKKCFQNALTILNKSGREDILFESEGLTTGRFKEIINASIQAGAL